MNSSSEMTTLKSTCEQFGLKYKEFKDVRSKLALLLKEISTEDKVLNTLSETIDDVKKGIEYILELGKVIDVEKITPKQDTLLTLLIYLWESEGIFSVLVQLIASILTENGHDIYDPLRMKFVKKYNELEKVSLFVKLQFIEEHGFQVITGSFDRELRNCIAHLRFTVKDNGAIDKSTGGKLEKKDFGKKNKKLMGICCAIIDIFAELIPAKKGV